MFDTMPIRPGRRRLVEADRLALLAERAKPVSASRTQLLPVLASLRDLLPDGGLRRGTTVGITAESSGGATTLALALIAAASGAGCWCVAVGLTDMGALAAHEMNLDLNRMAFVPQPGLRFVETVATLIEGIDLVLLHSPPYLRPGEIRRLLGRLRVQRAVLLVLNSGNIWPERCDVEMRVGTARWVATRPDGDCLRQRLAMVTATGRQAGNKPRRRQLWLPAQSQAVEIAEGKEAGWNG